MTSGAKYLQRNLLGGKVNFPLCLAPMVGLSHVGLRLLVKHYTPANAVTPWPTEMLSSWRLPKETLGQTPETFKGDEFPLVPQILGNEEEPIAESVRRLVEWGAAGVDINMGCPVSKALRHNYGVALMGDADYAAEVVAMTVRHAKVPVSVKLRAGLQKDDEFLLRFVRGLEQAGAAWVTLHPRVGAQKRRGAADWKQIRTLRDAVQIPIIGNGDVQCSEDVFTILEQTECDSVMVGRALAARPWLMWQVGEQLGFPPPPHYTGRAPVTPLDEGAEYGRSLLILLEILNQYFSPADARKRFRFHLRMTCGWLEFGHALNAACSRHLDFIDVTQEILRFFETPQRMCPRTSWRD